MAGNSLEMAGNSGKLLKMAKMTRNSWIWLEMAGGGWKWLVMAFN